MSRDFGPVEWTPVETEAIAEVADLDEEYLDSLGRTRGLSHLLDEAIRLPGGYRIGLDPIMGILPVVGDLPPAIISAYIILEGAYLGTPKATLGRMFLNLAVDFVFGSIPIVGPVFDAIWKANVRNVRLMEARLDDPGTSPRDRRVLVFVAAALILGLLLVAAIAAALAVAVVLLVVWFAMQVGAAVA